MNGRLLEMQFVWADKSKTNKTNKYLNKLFSCFINKSSYFKNCIFRGCVCRDRNSFSLLATSLTFRWSKNNINFTTFSR